MLISFVKLYVVKSIEALWWKNKSPKQITLKIPKTKKDMIKMLHRAELFMFRPWQTA